MDVVSQTWPTGGTLNATRPAHFLLTERDLASCLSATSTPPIQGARKVLNFLKRMLSYVLSTINMSVSSFSFLFALAWFHIFFPSFFFNLFPSFPHSFWLFRFKFPSSCAYLAVGQILSPHKRQAVEDFYLLVRREHYTNCAPSCGLWQQVLLE
jgi:hypothetical protein